MTQAILAQDDVQRLLNIRAGDKSGELQQGMPRAGRARAEGLVPGGSQGAIIVLDDPPDIRSAADEKEIVERVLTFLERRDHEERSTVSSKKKARLSVRVAARHDTLIRGPIVDTICHDPNKWPLVADAVKDLGLEHDLNLLPKGTLTEFVDGTRGDGSPGLIQKANLVSAFADEADVLLLLEPFADLDPAAAALLDGIIARECKVRTIIVSHPSDAVRAMADHAITLRDLEALSGAINATPNARAAA